MRYWNLKYKIGVLMLFLTVELSAQTNEMVMNDNRIDLNFVLTTELKTTISKHSRIEIKINLVLQKTSDSLYSVYVVNKTSESISIATQDWSLFLIQEAKNKNGEWKPVEYWQYSTCGNSYLSENIEPNEILKTESVIYFGDFKTEIRFKLLNNDQIYYSNSIHGFVNISQFSIPSNIIENETLARIKKVGGSKLMEKVLFLEPNGMKEYSEKLDVYLVKMAGLRKKRKN
jgi:hypothetical protein